MSTPVSLSEADPSAASVEQVVVREQWEALFAQVTQPHFTQCWAYGEGKRAQGWDVERLLISDAGEKLALCQVLIKRPLAIPVARINRGPLFLGSPSPAARLVALGALRKRWRFGLRGLLLIAPSLTTGEESRAVLRAAGFIRRRAAGWGSSQIDLQPPIEAIRAALSSKWRNHLNGSLKAGLELRVCRDTQGFDWMLERHAANMLLKGFVGPEVSFIRSMVAASPQDFRVVQAWLEGEPCCGILVARFGVNAETFISWTGEAARRAHAHHFALWHVLLELKQQGCRTLDLGGYTTLEKYGRFKRDMKGHEYSLAGEWLAL